MNCDKCKKKDNKGRYTHFSNVGFLCGDCSPLPSISLNELKFEKQFIEGYGWELNSRIKEMERRVILPYQNGSRGYYVGRRSENGRIQEKEPNY